MAYSVLLAVLFLGVLAGSIEPKPDNLDINKNDNSWVDVIVGLAKGHRFTTNIAGKVFSIELLPKKNGTTKVCGATEIDLSKALSALNTAVKKKSWFKSIITLVEKGTYSTNIGKNELNMELVPEKDGKTQVCAETNIDFGKALLDVSASIDKKVWLKGISKLLESYTNVVKSGFVFEIVPETNGITKVCVETDTKFSNAVMDLTLGITRSAWLKSIIGLVGHGSYTTKIGETPLILELISEPNDKTKICGETDSALLDLNTGIKATSWLKNMVGSVAAQNYNTNIGSTKLAIEISPEQNGKTTVHIRTADNGENVRKTRALTADKELQENANRK